MRRVLQVCGVAAAVAAMVSMHVPVTGAQGIVSGLTLPPISVVTPGMPVGVTIAVPVMASQPIMPGSVSGWWVLAPVAREHVTHKESRTSEPATIVLSE